MQDLVIVTPDDSRHNQELTRMPKAISIHVGLNKVDVNHYGDSLTLRGCHNDANDMAAIARVAGFSPTVLLDDVATASRLTSLLRSAESEMESGDCVLITYSGHGSQVADLDADEPEGLDETWVMFDRMLLDDELHAELSRFRRGVRILIISDSCHSGSVAKQLQYGTLTRAMAGATEEIEDPLFRSPPDSGFGKRTFVRHEASYREAWRGLPADATSLVQAAVVQISACQDEQLAADGVRNGLFTGKLKEVWDQGRFNKDHHAFVQVIRSSMPPTQSPGLLVFGLDTDDFASRVPFATRSATSTSTIQLSGTTTMSDADGKIWEEVRAELERRYPGLEVPIREPSGLEWGRQQAIGAGPRAPTGAPIVRTFWWGFHVEISSQSLRDFLSVADPASALVAAIGPATGPAAPFVLAIASFVRLALQTLRGLDRGNGVYVSMSWFAPGVFIPTSVPAGRHTAFRRLPGEPYEQAGDPWHRSYGGGLFGLRLEEDIYWNLPDGTERVEPIVHLNPLNFGNIYVRNWLSNDPTVGHFRLHVGVAAFAGGRVEVRMMIRDVESRRSSALVSGPRAVTREDLEPSRDPLIDEATVGGNGRPTARHVESLVE